MRLGKFKIANTLRHNPSVIKLLNSMTIESERPDFDTAGVTEVLAVFEEFDDINEGDVIPCYQFIFRRHQDGTEERLKVQRV